MRRCELNASVLRDDAGHARCDQQKCLAVVARPYDRNGFALKRPDLPIREDGFEPIANFNSGAMVVNRVQDQRAAIRGFTSNAPLMKKVDGVALNISAIERLYSHHGDLRMRLFVNLPADFVHLHDGILIQNVSEIIDVVGRFELGDRLGPRSQNKNKANPQRTDWTPSPFRG